MLVLVSYEWFAKQHKYHYVKKSVKSLIYLKEIRLFIYQYFFYTIFNLTKVFTEIGYLLS